MSRAKDSVYDAWRIGAATYVLVATTVTHASHRPTAESTKRKSRTIATAPMTAAQVVATTSKDWPVTAMRARVESGKTG